MAMALRSVVMDSKSICVMNKQSLGSGELDRQSLFPLWSLEKGVAFRGRERRCVYRFTIICISLYFEYSERIY